MTALSSRPRCAPVGFCAAYELSTRFRAEAIIRMSTIRTTRKPLKRESASTSAGGESAKGKAEQEWSSVCWGGVPGREGEGGLLPRLTESRSLAARSCF